MLNWLQNLTPRRSKFNALKNGRGVALADDNLHLYAWSKDNPSYTVGIKSIGPKSYSTVRL
nr:hypothetical protein [Lactiplantibacillus plantarum]